MSTYALISRSKPLDLGEEEGLASTHRQDVRTELTSIFDRYAQLSPNARLAEEHAERDRLLREVASQKAGVQADKSSRSNGLFGFLWGRTEETEQDAYDISNLNEHEFLEYEDIDEAQDGALCGTQTVLEMACIPQEAFRMARFHLASVKTRRDLPNVVRSSDGHSRLAIVGVGVVVDLEEHSKLETSDKDDLEGYIDAQDWPYDVSYARAIAVGKDLVIVSWGLPDGMIVCYRRVPRVGWEAIATLSPTRVVLERLLVSPDQHGSVLMSPLLYVTDMVPLTVENPNGGTPVVTLAVARLGSYIELIVLPVGLWRGPVPKSTRRKRKRRNKPPEHYAHGKVHNLCTSGEIGIVAMTTSDYHEDILCLETYRTSVDSNTEWDTDAFPHFPPAEYALIASGTMHGREVVSAWSIATLFPDTAEAGQGISLHVLFIDALDINGTEVCMFSSQTMIDQWRKARRVSLRQAEVELHEVDQEYDEAGAKQEAADSTDSANASTLQGSTRPVSTLSIPTPIVRMRLTSVAESKGALLTGLLAALDGSGGVTVIDCTHAIGMVAHDVVQEAQNVPALRLSCRLPPLAQTDSLGRPIVDIGWLENDGQSRQNSIQSFSIAVVRPCLLQVYDLALLHSANETDTARTSQAVSSVDLPFTPCGATIFESTQNMGLSLAAFRAANRRRRVLYHATLQRLGSTTVIDMLVQSARFTDAIAAADTMGVPASAESIQFCHKRLWEEEGNVCHLNAVCDAKYVVQQAVSILEENKGFWRKLDLSIARKALLVAIERVDESDSQEEADEIKAELEGLATRICTFILLCSMRGTQPTLRAFREKFLSVSLRCLAEAFASERDIVGLTIVFSRHRHELLKYQLDILDKIPSETPLGMYSHLLPAIQPEGDRDEYFLLGQNGSGGFKPWSSIGEYMEHTHGIKLLLDEDDEHIFMDRLRSSYNEHDDLEPASVKRWYVARAKRLRREIGGVSFLHIFCDCALRRLRASLPANGHGHEVDPVILGLVSLRTHAVFLEDLSDDGKLSTNALVTMSRSDIEKMSIGDRVALILGQPDKPMDILSKLRGGYMILSLGIEPERLERGIDEAICEYCRRAVLNCVISNCGSEIQYAQQLNALLKALGVCATIANSSRTTIQRSKRIIKHKTVLAKMIIDVAYNVSRVCKPITLLPPDCRCIVDNLWELFECLPASLSPKDSSDSSTVCAQTTCDGLYRHLVVVDLLSRWSSSTALGYLIDLTGCDDGRNKTIAENESQLAALAIGAKALAEICRSFCHEVSTVNAAAARRGELDLVDDLVSDVDQLNAVGFDGSLHLTQPLQEGLVKPLLEQGKFDLIEPLSEWIGRDCVQMAVLAFINDAMFRAEDVIPSRSGAAAAQRVQAAIKCQDVLGPHFPGLRGEFESTRRYLDTAHFVNGLLSGVTNDVVHPHEVRDRPPLDVIESLMARAPRCILDQCGDWDQHDFATRANHLICDHYHSRRQQNVDGLSPGHRDELPVLPGAAVYHLAGLLGVDGPRSLLVVKTRVIHYAILQGTFAAAAAVCATMIFDDASMWNDAVTVQCIVDSVAKVVYIEEYGDLRMKLLLCNGVLDKHRHDLSVSSNRAYETILDTFISLESMASSRRHHEPAVKSPAPKPSVPADVSPMRAARPAGSDFLVFRAAGIVAKTAQSVVRHAHAPTTHESGLGGSRASPRGVALTPGLMERVHHSIWSNYSTDIHSLFWILRGVAAGSGVDDPLLFILGRLIAFWCISDALRMRLQNVAPGPDQADFMDMLALGTSLLLHSQDEEALISCVSELRGVLKRESASAMELAASRVQPGSVRPDAGIVRTLVSRGYSENGARRAAIMTGNESAEVALVWAVTHTLDSGFDDPIVFLASVDDLSSPKGVDQLMVHLLQDAFDSTNDYLSRKRTLRSLLPGQATSAQSFVRSATQGVGRKSTAVNGIAANDEHGAKKVVGAQAIEASLRINESKERKDPQRNQTAKLPSSTTKSSPLSLIGGLPSSPGTQHRSSKKNPATASRHIVLPKSVGQRIDEKRSAGPTASKSTKLAVLSDKTKGKVASPWTVVSSKVPSNAPGTPHGHNVPYAASSPDGSSSLKLQDQRHIKSSPGTTPNLASDERQRLIAEGRRMLQEARATRTGKTAARTAPSDSKAAVSSRVGRYPLRSHLGATSSDKEKTPDELPSQVAAAAAAASRNEADEDDGDGWGFNDF